MAGVIDQLATTLFSPNRAGDNPFREILCAYDLASQSKIQNPKSKIFLEAHGCWGSLARVIGAILARELNRPVLYLTAHIPEADQAQDDLETFFGRPIELFPAAEAHEGAAPDPTSDIASQRLRIVTSLGKQVAGRESRVTSQEEVQSSKYQVPGLESKIQNLKSKISFSSLQPPASSLFLVAPIQALMQPVPAPDFLRLVSIDLAGGLELDGGPEFLARWLVDHGYRPTDQVDVIGEFAHRGGIIDVYAPGQDRPIRVEFFGDVIESIRFFDLDTQRSTGSIAGITLTSCKPLEVPGRGSRVASQDIVQSSKYQVPSSESKIQKPEVPGRGSQLSSDSRPATRDSGLEITTTLFSYLPADTLVILEDSTDIQEIGRIYLDRSGLGVSPKNALRSKELERDALATEELGQDAQATFAGLYPVENVLRQAGGFDCLYLNRFHAHAAEKSVALHAQSVQRFDNQGAKVIPELLAQAQRQQVHLFCESPAERTRFTELLNEVGSDAKPVAQPPSAVISPTPPRAAGPHETQEVGSDAKPVAVHSPTQPGAAGPHQTQSAINLSVGYLHHGFALPELNLTILAHHEIFGQFQQPRRLSRTRAVQAIDSFNDLEKGDIVVHVSHGVARFLGLKTIDKDGRLEEYLTLEYADKALLHVPVSKIELVHKYVGAMAHRPRLSKLGTKTWERQKEKVAEAVEDMAERLIQLQALRQTAPGIAYPGDTAWQNEFEASFPYQDTADQRATTGEIKRDMMQTRPMDRLLCGDVGYGKTELALRGAFKAVEFGKQVAVLVPTTVLADQHFRTFTQRLADYPFVVEVLSRFRTAREAKDIIRRTKLGQVDILIGTHRLISKDVDFKDLGLVVIDEEQRFGVEHKERLKAMRATVDVLTLTATPIPRTLHLALLGIRDISSLTTPPLDRRSIVTEVTPFDKKLIRQSILREMARDGQVYFLHNRVQSIDAIADELRQLVPEARFAVGHGQMPKHELEERMLDFLNRRVDVLVSTTIIESGLDIPNANTIIINDADRFGLAELHQLRGRVGRYKNRAYAYMLLPLRRAINPNAVRRLKAIEEYSQLGSGFRIAMRDLEIRGAGNILGVEQSGHIDVVGYEMYCQLLAAAVRRLRQEPEPRRSFTHLELGFNSHIPKGYIASDRQRMDVYRRLATCHTAAELDQLEKDLQDLYGKPPRPVRDLLQVAEIRALASAWNIQSIVRRDPDLIFTLVDQHSAEGLFASPPGLISMPEGRTIYLRLTPNYLQTPTTLLAVLRKLLSRTTPKGS